MSADNGIYILKTKDQYRVKHTQAIERIYDSYSRYEHLCRYNPIEVVMVWGGCRYTRSKEKAYEVAEAMSKSQYTEYGIRTFEYNKTWKYILEDAKELARIEKEKLLKSVKINEQYSHEKYQLQCCEWILGL